jgi:predicted transcriptional regulator of viral defense system
MKTTILSSLEKMPYFSLEAVLQLFEGEELAPGTVQTLLYRWMKNGLVYQLRNGLYTTSRFVETHRSDLDFAPAISAVLIHQSYVSLEFVLQRSGILTEITYPITAVTLKHTRVIENKLGTFSYRTLRADLYLGYELHHYAGIPFAMATPAKALFDTLYFRPLPAGFSPIKSNLAEELRLNLDDFSTAEIDEFAGYVTLSKSKKMLALFKNLKGAVWPRSSN